MSGSYTYTLRFDNYVVWVTTSVTTNDCYSNMSTVSSPKTDSCTMCNPATTLVYTIPAPQLYCDWSYIRTYERTRKTFCSLATLWEKSHSEFMNRVICPLFNRQHASQSSLQRYSPRQSEPAFQRLGSYISTAQPLGISSTLGKSRSFIVGHENLTTELTLTL